MKLRDHELLLELREIRQRLRKLAAEEEGARGQLAEKTGEWRKSREIQLLRANVAGTISARLKAQEIMNEILLEIETGQTGRPLLDAITEERNLPPAAETSETSDERQRGPTAKTARSNRPLFAAKAAERDGPPGSGFERAKKLSPDRQVPEEEPAASNSRIAATLLGPAWTDADIDKCVEEACHPPRSDALAAWQRLRGLGCDDAKILEVLREIWPSWKVYTGPDPPRRPGFWTCGGEVPKLWIDANFYDHSTKDQPPTLSGLALAARVRTVQDLPRVPYLPASVVDPVKLHPPKRRKGAK